MAVKKNFKQEEEFLRFMLLGTFQRLSVTKRYEVGSRPPLFHSVRTNSLPFENEMMHGRIHPKKFITQGTYYTKESIKLLKISHSHLAYLTIAELRKQLSEGPQHRSERLSNCTITQSKYTRNPQICLFLLLSTVGLP